MLEEAGTVHESLRYREADARCLILSSRQLGDVKNSARLADQLIYWRRESATGASSITLAWLTTHSTGGISRSECKNLGVSEYTRSRGSREALESGPIGRRRSHPGKGEVAMICESAECGSVRKVDARLSGPRTLTLRIEGLPSWARRCPGARR